MTLRTLNYGNYGIVLIMGNAGFCPSAVWFMELWVSGIAVGVVQGRNHGCVVQEVWKVERPCFPTP